MRSINLKYNLFYPFNYILSSVYYLTFNRKKHFEIMNAKNKIGNKSNIELFQDKNLYNVSLGPLSLNFLIYLVCSTIYLYVTKTTATACHLVMFNEFLLLVVHFISILTIFHIFFSLHV